MAFFRTTQSESLFSRTEVPNSYLPVVPTPSTESHRLLLPKTASLRSGPSSRPKLTIDTSVLSVERYRAKLEFMNTFREFSAAGQRRQWREKLLPQLEYLSEIERQRLKPESSFFCGKLSPRHLNFQEFGLGDSYASAMSVAISKSPSVESLNFKNNRLRESGSLKIIETLNVRNGIKELNLSENRLGAKSVEALAGVLQSLGCSIEVLGLERSLIQREHASWLFTSLIENKSLRVLNLARNELSGVCAKALKVFLMKNAGVEVLDLHWNTLNGPAAVHFFVGLANNSHVKVLDLSWNSLGRSSDPEVCASICRMYRDNITLVHLDLSNNYFTYGESQILADGIKVNHSILGIHLEGNDVEQDAMGFLKPVREKRKDIESHMSPRMLGSRNYKSVRKMPEHCWVCNKWQDANFVWSHDDVHWTRRLKQLADEHHTGDEPILLHLDIDDFRPCTMDHCLDGTYQVARAVPHKGVRFFFTFRGVPQISSAYTVFTPMKAMETEVEFDVGVRKTLVVQMLNELVPMGKVCSVDEDFPVEARCGEWIFRYPNIEIAPIVPEWTLETSAFKAYKLDSEVVLRECLESDIEHTKLPSLFKSQEGFAKVKETLSLAYKHLYFPRRKEAFRYFCNFEKFQSFKLTLSSFTDFANLLKLVDGKTLRIGDLDTDIKASTVSTEFGSQNIAAITRSEFIEAMVRIALDKYYRTQICKTEAEAVEKLVYGHLIPAVPMLESDKWRYARYLNEECDFVLTENEPSLQKLYAKYSGKVAQFGEKPWMSLDEFAQCCGEVGLFSKTFGLRQYALCYQLALIMPPDAKKTPQMSYVEFLEAFARVADYIDNPEAEKAIYSCVWDTTPLHQKLTNTMQEWSRQLRAVPSRKTQLGVDQKLLSSIVSRVSSSN